MKTVEEENKPKVKKRKTSLNESVQVVVRCRPMSTKEKSEKNVQVINVWPKRGVIEITNPKDDQRSDNQKTFTYDSVYDWNSTQQEIYDTTVRPLVSSVLEGFNGCVFAYGQTGTGKTYTMEGVRTDPEHVGVIPKTFHQIWTHINRTKNMQFLVSASYMEIHLEEIKDLLKRDHTQRLEIREIIGRGVYIPNLHTITCKSVDDMLYVMSMGNKNRTIGCTQMNEHSSRSHAIFSVTIEMCNTEDNSFKVGKLNLVDLAGSERQSKTGASAERLKEASKINRALSALGNVISALAENSPHVPYRDSKLTRLLQDSLGGNSKTIMIANVGPASYNYEETLTTLRYAHRAKTIKNKPVKNEDPKDAKLREYQEEIKRLKQLIEERKHQETVVVKKVKKVKIVKRRDPISDDRESPSPILESSPEPMSDLDQTVDVGEQEAQMEEQLRVERVRTEELALRLQSLESQLIRGGKNILDAMNEKQIQLEQQLNEIAERKRRETEMQQMLELEEETNTEFREGFSNLQQEAELKSRKLKKLFSKLTGLKQELVDIKEDHNRDCREMETTQESLVKELKLKIMIIDNFVPPEDKQWMLNNARYDENIDEWVLPPPTIEKITHRPVARPELDQPYCEHAINKMKLYDCPHRYKTENILNLGLDMPLKTTNNYRRPEVSPTLRAVLEAALQNESDLDIDDEGPRGTVSARTQAQMDAIASNLAVKRDTQRANVKSSRRYSGTPGPLKSACRKSVSGPSTSKLHDDMRK